MLSWISKLSPLGLGISGLILMAIIGIVGFPYVKLHFDAEQISTLTAQNSTANNQITAATNLADQNAAAAAQIKQTSDKQIAAAKHERDAAVRDAKFYADLKDQISHAKDNDCLGSAMRSLIDGVHTDQLNASGRTTASSHQSAAP